MVCLGLEPGEAWMVGADESTDLCRHPLVQILLCRHTVIKKYKFLFSFF